MDDGRRLTRRASLAGFGGLIAALAGGRLFGAGSAEGAGAGPAGIASGAVSCVLAPEMTEGPFYIPDEKVRRNITEGKVGTPLTLQLAVVDASTCRPIKNAAVDIWHADASGVYSGEASQESTGRTFLRGIQRTNAKGIARFDTIYPGWYPGRTVHIHVKVHVGGSVVHTGQLFFRDSVTDAVYRKTPYSRRPNRNPRNSADAIYRNGGSRSLLALRKQGKGYVGAITMGVQRR